MGNYPAANFLGVVQSPIVVTPYLQHACFTFVPSTSDFLTGFTTSVQSYVYPDPVTNLGLVAVEDTGGTSAAAYPHTSVRRPRRHTSSAPHFYA